jgi:hypothetical protein
MGETFFHNPLSVFLGGVLESFGFSAKLKPIEDLALLDLF